MTHTIWTATQELNIDNLIINGRTFNVLDMISDDDSFLQIPCTILNGSIFIGSVEYKDADMARQKLPKETTMNATTNKTRTESKAITLFESGNRDNWVVRVVDNMIKFNRYTA